MSRRVGEDVRVLVYRRDGLKCRYCGIESPSRNDFHLDHAVAYVNGGTHTLDNLVVACVWCNQVKHARTWTVPTEPVTRVEGPLADGCSLCGVQPGVPCIGRTRNHAGRGYRLKYQPDPLEPQDPLDVLGVAEVAERLNVSTAVIANWMRRGKMPEPDAVLRAGSVWMTETIAAWEATR